MLLCLGRREPELHRRRVGLLHGQVQAGRAQLLDCGGRAAGQGALQVPVHLQGKNILKCSFTVCLRDAIGVERKH